MIIGFDENGKPFDIPLQHTIVSAITRYGKSTCLQRMIDSLPAHYKTLVFDVKRPRDYKGLGREIPIYLYDYMEPMQLKNMMEHVAKMPLGFQFPELIRVCEDVVGESVEGNYSLRDVFEGVADKLAEVDAMEQEGKRVPGITKDRLIVLQTILGQIVRDMDKVSFSSELSLDGRVNVMDLSECPDSVKQLSVFSSIRKVLRTMTNVVLVLDEAPDYAPQKYDTPSKQEIINVTRKGGASGVWMWLAGQTITGLDKQVLKNCNIWVLGRQTEINEAKRIVSQIPFKTSIKPHDVMRLDVGRFYAITPQEVSLIYVWPTWLDRETAVRVATGDIPTPTSPVNTVVKGGDVEEYRKALETMQGRLAAQEEVIRKLQAEVLKRDETIGEIKDALDMLIGAKPELTPISITLANPSLSLKERERTVIDESSPLGRVVRLYADNFFSVARPVNTVAKELGSRGVHWSWRAVKRRLEELARMGLIRYDRDRGGFVNAIPPEKSVKVVELH